MLSASRILKSININKEINLGIRLLSLNLNENSNEILNNGKRVTKKWKNEIEFLETNTRRHGRTDPLVFVKCLQVIRNEDITSKEGLLLLKCCGPLMFNQPKSKRNEYLNEVWSLLQEKRVPIDIMHYNLLIKMYTENGYKFDPGDFLNEIKRVGLRPNIRTYEFIVNKYCLDGKLDKVTELLEQMNKQNLSLTSPMFDSLILGHFVNKDIKTAQETFELMKESKVFITSSTYKNLIIGYLLNCENINAIDEIKKLLNESSIQFEINYITEILDHIPSKSSKFSIENAIELKELLIGRLLENENFYNELSNCCYNLILKGEYDFVKHLYTHYFIDQQSQEYFIKRLLVSVLKSGDSSQKYINFVVFLKELYPSFNFRNYARSTLLANEEFTIDKILPIIGELNSVFDAKEKGIYVSLIEKCKNEMDLHRLTEQYLAGLDGTSWINHIKKFYLTRIEEVHKDLDLIQFMDGHIKFNNVKREIELLGLAIYCKYFDELEIEKMDNLNRKFKIDISLLSNGYLIGRANDFIEQKLDKIHLLPIILKDKIMQNDNFLNGFMQLCLEKVKDDQMLIPVIKFYSKRGLILDRRAFKENESKKLIKLFKSVNSPITNDELTDKLVNKQPIELDRLSKLENSLKQHHREEIFFKAIKYGHLQLANYFYETTFQLSLPKLIDFTLLKLKGDEDKHQIMKFLDNSLNKLPPGQQLISSKSSLHLKLNEIFDLIKDDSKLIPKFITRISTLLDPSTLHDSLTYFYKQTFDQQIGENLCKLTKFLHKSASIANRIFTTMVLFIEAKNTLQLQLLCDDISQLDGYSKNRTYQELAIAFILTERYKQAIKVIKTDDFSLDRNVALIFKYLKSIEKSEIIKQFAILVYQNSKELRNDLLAILNYSLCEKLNDDKLFEEILLEIKQMNLDIDESNKEHEQSKQQNKRQRTGSIDLNVSKENLIDLVDRIIKKKIALNLSVECELIEKLLNLNELEITVNLVHDMLINERYPIPATIKNLLKELNLKSRIDLINLLEPNIPLPLKESEFYKSNKVVTYLRTTNSEMDIENCIKSIEIFSADLIDQILSVKPNFENKIVHLLKEKKKSNLNYVWLHFMKNSKFDQANDLIEQNQQDINVQNLLYQPVLNLIKQTNNIQLARQLADYSIKFNLKTTTIQSINNAYIKLCLSSDLIDEATQSIERHYKLKPNIKLNLKSLDEQLIKKLDQSFIDKYIKINV